MHCEYRRFGGWSVAVLPGVVIGQAKNSRQRGLLVTWFQEKGSQAMVENEEFPKFRRYIAAQSRIPGRYEGPNTDAA
jgi:hypothetical protein